MTIYFTNHAMKRAQERLRCESGIEIRYAAEKAYARIGIKSKNALANNYLEWLSKKEEGTEVSLFGGYAWFFKTSREGAPILITVYRFTMDEALRHGCYSLRTNKRRLY